MSWKTYVAFDLQIFRELTGAQSVFLIDLPKKKESASHTVATAFFEELAYFLKASALNENIISKLNLFDFSSTSHIAFVHTM